jgi:hypothetical protein
MKGKLLKLKNWVTVKDAASYLSLVLEDTVNESDLIQLALEKKLTISVFLHEAVTAVSYQNDNTDYVSFLATTADDSTEEIISRFQNDPRKIWRYVSDDWDFHRPNFHLTFSISQLNDLLVTETSSWLLNQMLLTSFAKPSISESQCPRGPIMLFDPGLNVLCGLIELLPKADDDQKSLADRAVPVTTLPASASLVVSRETLAKFTASLLSNEADTDQNAPPAATDDDSEIKRLQRTVAALALGLAAKPGTYNKAGKPNVSQLAKLATEHLRDATSDRTPPGFGDSTVRNTITAALNACPELKG